MPTSSPRQRKTLGRVMHEFKHGELKSGPGGKAGKVKSRRQAIAIALKEAGASKYESKSENKKTSGAASARNRAARPTSRNGKASRTSAPADGARAAARWGAGTPRARLREGARPP